MLVKNTYTNGDVVDALQEHLSELHLVYSHLHNFHWNLEGPSFVPYHEHLQEMYEDVAEKIDEVAERLLMIGERPFTKLEEYKNHTSLEEVASKPFTLDEVARNVLFDLNHIIDTVRRGIFVCENSNRYNDEGTMDFFIQLLRDYEKSRWFWSAIDG